MDRKDLKNEIEIPEEITANIVENKIIMKKENNELQRRLEGKVDIKIEGNKVILEVKKSTKNEKKV